MKFILPDNLPDILDTGIVPSCVVLQLGGRLSDDDHLVDGERPGLPNLIIDRLRLLVSEFTLARPAPANPSVVIALVEAADSSDVEAFHHFWNCLPAQPKTIANLVEAFVAAKFIPF